MNGQLVCSLVFMNRRVVFCVPVFVDAKMERFGSLSKEQRGLSLYKRSLKINAFIREEFIIEMVLHFGHVGSDIDSF